VKEGCLIRSSEPVPSDDERVDVYEDATGNWHWVYSHERAGLSLRSNDDFESEAGAVSSVRVAYPKLDPVIHPLRAGGAEERARLPRRPEFVKLLGIAATVAAVIWLWRRQVGRAETDR
jgi:hypothetical protein